MSRESDADFRRRTDRELDHASWRAVRPVFLIFVLVLVCIWAASSKAETVILNCTEPTANTDGTPITAALTYTAYWGTSSSSLTNTAAMAGPGCKGSVIVPDAAPGKSATYYFAVTATAAGIESGKSNVASKTVSTPLPTPNPPILLTTGGIVYQASPDWVKFAFKLGAPVGSIATGIKCDCTRKIGDEYCRVTGPIVWTAGKKDYVVARCIES